MKTDLDRSNGIRPVPQVIFRKFVSFSVPITSGHQRWRYKSMALEWGRRQKSGAREWSRRQKFGAKEWSKRQKSRAREWSRETNLSREYQLMK